MSDYVKCEDVFDAIERIYGKCEYSVYSNLFDEIDALPSADVEEVVRCGECKYWDNKQYGCCNMLDMNCEENDYCSWGERKDNESV